MNANSDPQLVALAWIVYGSLVACIAAIVALVRSGRTVPPLGGISITRAGRQLDLDGSPSGATSPFLARRVSEASTPISGIAGPPARGR